MGKENDINIIMLGEDKKEDMLALFNEVFNRDFDLSFWENKHEKNPMGKTLFWGAVDNNELIAMNGFIPMKYVINDQILCVLESCESAVKEEYRNRGLFSRIISEAEKWAKENGYDFMMGFPNPFSLPGFLKRGWIKVGKANVYGKMHELKILGSEKGFRPIADLLLIKSWLNSKFEKRLTDNYVITEEEMPDFSKQNEYFTCSYDNGFWKWKNNYKLLKVYKVEQNDGSAMTLVIDHNALVYISCDDVINKSDAIKAFTQKVSKQYPYIEVCIDSKMLPEDDILKAGFVSRRLAPCYRIIKVLSDKIKLEDYENRFIFQSLEED